MTSVAANQHHPGVCHSKRSVCRKDLPTLGLKLSPEWVEVVPPARHAKDSITLSKEIWPCGALPRPPLLVFPNACLRKLLTLVPQDKRARSSLSRHQLFELRKTASKVKADAWGMDVAAAYLRNCATRTSVGIPGTGSFTLPP